MNEDRLIEIETKIAFHEKTIKDLNDVLYEQQKEVKRLADICDALTKRVREFSAFTSEIEAQANVKPPHY